MSTPKGCADPDACACRERIAELEVNNRLLTDHMDKDLADAEALHQQIAELERERENYLNEALNACRATVEQARAEERERCRQAGQNVLDGIEPEACRERAAVMEVLEAIVALGDKP